MTEIGRIVTRSQKEDGKVDLLLGLAFKGEQILKPNTVYAIRECLGELLLIDLGASAIKDPKEPSPINVSWAHTATEIHTYSSGVFILTDAEACKISNKDKHD